MQSYSSIDMHIGNPVFVVGQRGASKLLYGGYDFTKAHTAQNGTKWVCAKKNITKCRARIKLHLDKRVEVLNGEHNHLPNESLLARHMGDKPAYKC